MVSSFSGITLSKSNHLLDSGVTVDSWDGDGCESDEQAIMGTVKNRPINANTHVFFSIITRYYILYAVLYSVILL